MYVLLILRLVQLGQKADYYKQNQSEFSHKSLLRDFGVNEKLADEMLVDKGILFKQRTYQHQHRSLTNCTPCYDRLQRFAFLLWKHRNTI